MHIVTGCRQGVGIFRILGLVPGCLVVTMAILFVISLESGRDTLVLG